MNKKAKIIISATSDLYTDQRVLKTARSLYNNGYEILLIGRELHGSKELTVPYEWLRLKLFFKNSFFFYAEYNLRLFFLLLSTKADIFFSIDTDTLLANYTASLFKSKKLIFDAHELFPEVPELSNRKTVKSIWEFIEATIFPRLNFSYTVCESISNYYFEKYGIKMEVVRNVPYLNQAQDKKIYYEGKKILLYQGALNVGRGLEWIIDSLPYLENVILYIIGDGDIKQELENKVNSLDLSDKVVFHGKVAAEELSEYTSSADLGLCMLEQRGLSYYYSLPNRIFDYMHAGVAILSSPFPEIKKIVEKYNTGFLTSETNPVKLAEFIKNILNNPPDTTHFKQLSTEFCWEKEERIILKIVEKCINS